GSFARTRSTRSYGRSLAIPALCHMGRGSSTRQTRERTPEFRGPLAAVGGRRCRLAGRDSLWEVDEYPVALQPTEGDPEGVRSSTLTREGGTRHHSNT